MVMSERKGLRIRLKFFPHERLIDGGAFDLDGEHWRKSRNGSRAENKFSLGLEPKVPTESPNGKYSEELDIQVEPRENSGLEIGISKC